MRHLKKLARKALAATFFKYRSGLYGTYRKDHRKSAQDLRPWPSLLAPSREDHQISRKHAERLLVAMADATVNGSAMRDMEARQRVWDSWDEKTRKENPKWL